MKDIQFTLFKWFFVLVALNHVLIHTTSPEVTETALELVRSIAENPDLSLELAKSPLCTTLVKHIAGKWQTPEFHDHRTDACDLLVLILGHDASMKLIYNQEEGKFLNIFKGEYLNNPACSAFMLI